MSVVGKLTLETQSEASQSEAVQSLVEFPPCQLNHSRVFMPCSTRGGYSQTTANSSSYPNSQVPRSVQLVDVTWSPQIKLRSNISDLIKGSTSSSGNVSSESKNRFTQYNFDNSLWKYRIKNPIRSGLESKSSKSLYSSPVVFKGDTTDPEIDKAFVTSEKRPFTSDYTVNGVVNRMTDIWNAQYDSPTENLPQMFKFTVNDRLNLVTSDDTDIVINSKSEPECEKFIVNNGLIYQVPEKKKQKKKKVVFGRKKKNGKSTKNGKSMDKCKRIDKSKINKPQDKPSLTVKLSLTKPERPSRKRAILEVDPDQEFEARERKKRVGPRSRIGCWTCRIRHKACPENKPVCDQCVRLKLVCDYSQDRPAYMSDPTLQKEKLKEIRDITNVQKKINFTSRRRGE